MNHGAAIACMLVLSGLLSGCADSAQAPDAPESLDTLVAPTATTNGTSDWWLAQVALTNGTGFSAFVWDVPSGAYDESVAGSHLNLEVAVLGETAAAVEEYGIILASLNSRASFLAAGYTGHEETISRSPLGTTATPGSQVEEPRRFSFLVSTAPDDLGMVLTARGNATEAWIAWRVYEASQPLPTSSQAYVEARTGPAKMLEPVGRGEDWTIAAYVELNAALATGISIALGNPSIVDSLDVPDLRPMVTARDVTISSELPASGWGHGLAIYLGADGAARWNVDAFNQGTQLTMEDGIWTAGPNLLAILVLGLPGFQITGDGQGGSDMNFRLEVVDINRLEIILFEHVALDRSMAQLFGVPAESIGALTGTSPMVRTASGVEYPLVLGQLLVVEP